MAYKKINSKVCVANVLNNYDIQQMGWISRSPEWINTGLGLMYMTSNLTYAEPKDVTISEYKGELPCDIKLLRAVEYEGKRLHCISNPINTLSSDDLELETHLTDNYSIDQAGYIITTFEEGTVRIHYMKLPVELDTDFNIWFPLIPDNTKVIDALEQYLLYRILTKGYLVRGLSLEKNNPLVNPGLAWEIKKKKAENSEIIRDVDELQEISQITRTFLYDNNVYDNRHFNNSKES